MKKLLNEYTNGNYNVKIYEDGTKVKETEEEEFIPEFPESMDIKITNYCDMDCKYCHENSNRQGKHAELHKFMTLFDSLKAGTELAIGGGNPLDHPHIYELLNVLRARGVIANMTINQKHFFQEEYIVDFFVKNKLIHGVGISVTSVTNEQIEIMQKYDNLVVHLINGVTTPETFEKLSSKGLKVLILGYKDIRRGATYFKNNSELVDSQKYYLKDNMFKIFPKFKVVSFDNLALEQLELKEHLPTKLWERFYQGDDGSHTMYIDMVKEEYAVSSTSSERFNLTTNNKVKEIFNKIRR